MESKLDRDASGPISGIGRREFLQSAATAAVGLAVGDRTATLEPTPHAAATALGVALQKDAVIAQIAPQHAQTVKMVQDWIALPSIAAENRGYPQGPEYMAD